MTRTRFKECHRLARLGSLGTLALSTSNEFFGWMLHEVYDVRFPHIGDDRHAARTVIARQGQIVGTLRNALFNWHHRRGGIRAAIESSKIMTTSEQYEEKKQARIERLEERAANAQDNANSLHEQAQRMASIIPMGQPILIGHHSEKRDRNYRGRIENKFRKAHAEQDKAAYYTRQAEAAASNTAIFSDDPAATEKLAEKIARLEKQQEIMKSANKAIRKGDDEALRDLGFSDSRITLLKQPDFCGRIGFADYALTNNSANIRRLKQRLGRVTVAQAAPEVTIEGTNARFEDCPSENRVRLFYPGKPSDEIRTRLKSAGFRWSPTNGAWQAFRNWHAIETAKKEAGLTQPQTAAPVTEPAEVSQTANSACEKFNPLVNGGDYRGTFCCTCGQKEELHSHLQPSTP